MRPASRSGSQRAFCAGVAYSAKVRIGPKLPNCTTSALRGHTAAICSMAMTASISVPPTPPSASGMVMAMRPWALISFATSKGKRASLARLAAPGGPERGRPRAEIDRRVPAHELGERRGAAALGRMRELAVGHQLEQHGAEMDPAADPGRGVVEPARLLLVEIDQLADR